mmetsp:Transcript_8684/g.14618  ORF Transcript_8684/g.14618 Transcript_8684/m.14618 type:complete len:179 (+) Transcript_8684:2503-3039(+)
MKKAKKKLQKKKRKKKNQKKNQKKMLKYLKNQKKFLKKNQKKILYQILKKILLFQKKTDNIATEQVENKEEPKEESIKDKQNPLPDETDKLNEIPVEEIVPEEKDNVPPKTNISENKVQPTVEPSPPINRSAEIPVVEPEEEEVEEERPSPGGITKFVRDIILSCFSPLLVIFFPRQD